MSEEQQTLDMEDAPEMSPPVEDKATKRKTLSLGERIKVVDYLRSLVEPVVADSQAAVASMVSDATKVEINWQQLKYMIEDLPEFNLSAKLHVKSALGEDDGLAALEKRVADLESRLSVVANRIDDGAN